MNDNDDCQDVPLALICVEATVIEILAKAVGHLKAATMMSRSGAVEDHCEEALSAIRKAMRAAGA